MVNRLRGVVIVAVLSFTMPIIVQAEEEPPGVTITSISGFVEVMKRDETRWQKAMLNSRLYPLEKVRTKLMSRVVLSFDDGSVVKLSSGSLVDIKELMINKRTGTTESAIKLWSGELLGRIEKLKGRDSKFEIYSPTAIIGIRGTIVKAKVLKSGKTEVIFLRGMGTYRGISQKQEEAVEIKENESAESSLDGSSITAPKLLKEKEIKKLLHKEKEFIEALESVKRVKPKLETELKQEVFVPEWPTEQPLSEIETPTVIKRIPLPIINLRISQPRAEYIKEPVEIAILIRPQFQVDELPAINLKIDNHIITLPPGVNKYLYKPILTPGINVINVSAQYKGGPIASNKLTTPFFDPFPPVFQTREIQICNRICQIKVSVRDNESGIRKVWVNGEEMQRMEVDRYVHRIPLLRIKEELPPLPPNYLPKQLIFKLKAIDKAGNITQIKLPYLVPISTQELTR